VEALKKAGHSLPSLVDIAAVSFFNQVFRDGFFHGDLHPGNLFVLPNGTIAVVDFGIMGRLDKKSRLYLAQILHGFLTEDYMNLAQVHFDAGLVPANKSVENFALALMALTKPIIGQKLSDISVGRLLGQLFATAKAFEMQVQPHLLLLQKNMMITEGVGRMLNPDVNMWQIAAPLIGQWAKDNLSPRAQLKEHTLEAFALAKRLASLKEQRSRYHREWLRFAWAVLLAVCACIYYTKR
jgi:ubiquinone biosynthesis protein